MKKEKGRKLLLEDGTVFHGTAFGSTADTKMELVFHTSMVGYTEILSDPSYTYQGVVMTYPLIGNYGVCEDDYETDRPRISALIVSEYCDKPSNFRCEKSLDTVMKEYDIAGISDIDTRSLARHIREFGSCKAYILSEDYPEDKAMEELQSYILPKDAVSYVSTKKIYEYEESSAGSYHVVAIDCGLKKNILREMKAHDMRVTVVPWDTSADTIKRLKPDGVFISNGPGNPEDAGTTIKTIQELIGTYPIFGICLGHQIISLAYGAKTYKLKFGHRGGNHPVKHLMTDHVEITSQNHSYAVDEKSLSMTRLLPTHINLLDHTIEGVACNEDFVFSVQYHPESAPGPQDSSYLFEIFKEKMKTFREEN